MTLKWVENVRESIMGHNMAKLGDHIVRKLEAQNRIAGQKWG